MFCNRQKHKIKNLFIYSVSLASVEHINHDTIVKQTKCRQNRHRDKVEEMEREMLRPRNERFANSKT